MIKLFSAGMFILFFSIISFSQTEPLQTSNLVLKENVSTSFQTYFSNNSLSVEYAVQECDPRHGYDAEYVLLRFTNKTKKQIDLSWYMDKYYNEVCNSCKYPDEYYFELSLGANEVLEGTCDIECDFRLKIFSKFIDPQYTGRKARLTSFQLNQLQLLFK